MAKLTVTYWLTPEPRYGPIHVERLRSNLRRHTQAELLVLEDFPYGFPGYLRILEAFAPEHALAPGEVRVLTGLDTVFTGPSDWLWNPGVSPYLALPLWPWLRREINPRFSNALAAYDEGGRVAVWDEVQKMKRRRMIGQSGSEMDVMRAAHARLGSTVLGSPETIVSYPMQISPPNKDWERDLRVGDYDHVALSRASVVYFHGEPKQDTLRPDDPVRIEWERP